MTTMTTTADEGPNVLPDDLIIVLLHWLSPIDLLRSVSFASRKLAAPLSNVTFWRRHPSLPRLLTGNLILTRHQLQRCCIFSSEAVVPKYLEPGSVLVPRECALALHNHHGTAPRVCLASTTDNTTEQIDNVLPKNGIVEDWGPSHPLVFPTPPRQLFMRRKYWSSSETPTHETEETLLFTTRYPLALISEVAIKPFTDNFGQTYTWQNIVIKVYRLQLGAETLLDPNPPGPASGFPCAVSRTSRPHLEGDAWKVAPDQDTIDSLLASREPIYQCPVHDTPPPENDSWQRFSLPAGVAGNVITVTLIGKNFRQFQDSGYYVCVERVAVHGIPLYAHPKQANEWEALVVEAQRNDDGHGLNSPPPLASLLLFAETNN